MFRRLTKMPYAKAFVTDNGNEELCNATGWEFCENGDNPNDSANWWNEYQDCNGNTYYGR